MGNILRNMVRCKRCGATIESCSVHDFVTCPCGAVSVDGGREYLRRVFEDKGCFEELSVVEDESGLTKGVTPSVRSPRVHAPLCLCSAGTDTPLRAKPVS